MVELGLYQFFGGNKLLRILSNFQSFRNYFTEPTKHGRSLWKVSCSEHTRFLEIDLAKMYDRFPKTQKTVLTDWVSVEAFLPTCTEKKLHTVSARGELYVETDHEYKRIRFLRISNV